ncbi:MAG TPA: PAS domain S-box protein, partial [Opitutaceae bacterium]|nr:PAS domain S-box protein [Opitutaceae bacterium]
MSAGGTRSLDRWWGAYLGAGLALYTAAIPLAFRLLDPSGTISSIWPAIGVALALLLLTERRRWPWVLVGVVLVTFASNLMVGKPLAVSLVFALLGPAEPLAIALVLTARGRDRGPCDTVAGVLAFILAAAVGSGLAAGLAAGLLWPLTVAGPVLVFRTWWTSHALGLLLVTPLLVAWGTPPWRIKDWRLGRWFEAVLLVAVTLVIVNTVLGALMRGATFPRPYFAFVAVIWGAVRFGLRGVTAVLVGIGVGAVWALYDATASVALLTGMDALTGVQLFLGVVAVAGLVLGASVTERADALRSLRESEARFRELHESALQAMGVVRGGRLEIVNPAFARMFGVRPQAVAGRWLREFVAEGDRLELDRQLAARGRLAPEGGGELRGLRLNGEEFPLELRLGALSREDADGLLASFSDLTEQRRAEREYRRANRALRTISSCSQALVRAGSEDELLQAICRTLIADQSYVMAWVGFAQDDADRQVRPVAVAGRDQGYVARAAVSWGDNERGRGPAGRAIRTAQPVACQDMLADPDYAPWRDDAKRHGFRASIALPLRDGTRAFGVLSFYAAEVGAFEPAEVTLLQEMADSLAYGILACRSRQRQQQAETEVRRLLLDEERMRLALLGILEDQKRAEEALTASEERYRNAMMNSAIGMALVGLDGRWLEVNPTLCRVTGYTQQELLATTFQAITHPDDLAEDVTMVRSLLEGRLPAYEREKRYVHKEGYPVWINLNVSLQRDAEGKPLHFISQVQDITARRQAEDSLAEAAERLSVALEASKFGIWRHNLQTHETEWDARMFAIFGLPMGLKAPPVDEILMLVVEEDRPLVQRSWQALPTCDLAYHQRFRIRRSDGVLRSLELQGLVHLDRLGRPEWSVGVAGDVTDIVEASTEAERLRAQLQQAQKMEALGNLAAGVAHDFNNLLTGINGFVELASTSLAPGHEAAELLAQARRGALSARDLVRRILNFSRSRPDQPRALVNLADTVRDTAPLLSAAMPGNVSISIAIDCAEAMVLADPGQMQQVLMNLCTNAAHAIGSNPGQIHVSLEAWELEADLLRRLTPACAAGRYIRLAIRDSGCGMSEETRRRIFEPFFTTKKEGTGLGLAIVRDIVAAHEGGLEVESQPGKGATFAVYLPSATAAPQQLTLPVASAPAG